MLIIVAHRSLLLLLLVATVFFLQQQQQQRRKRLSNTIIAAIERRRRKEEADGMMIPEEERRTLHFTRHRPHHSTSYSHLHEHMRRWPPDWSTSSVHGYPSPATAVENVQEELGGATAPVNRQGLELP